MSDQDHDSKSQSRRKVLKGIAAGGGIIATGKALPEKWKAPLVESVFVPAHAQTTCECTACTYTGESDLERQQCNEESPDTVAPPITIVVGSDCSVQVTLDTTRAFFGVGTMNAGCNTFCVTVSRTEQCGEAGNDGSGQVCGTISGNTVTGTIDISGSCDCGEPIQENFYLTGTFEATCGGATI